MPEKAPLVLFGPNNAGKSNIIDALHRALGERWPQSIEMLDSDFYMRDRAKHPSAHIRCEFNQQYCSNKDRNRWYDHFNLFYYSDEDKNGFRGDDGSWPSINKAVRSSIQSILVDADRSIAYQLSYSSRYTLLSKFSHAVHNALNSDEKDALEEAYWQIKQVFETDNKFGDFFDAFSKSVQESVKGFVHHLEIDFSAYDPNNYANSMRIVAKEGNQVRTFSEFGTGEQQILLMAFAKAYMQVFGADSIVLILEEPEAHLHPLAQRWLKEYIYDICESGIQVIVSTHCPDFVDPGNLEGLVRVSKDQNGSTQTTQLSRKTLVDHCVSAGVPEHLINTKGVAEFYEARLFPDALKGLFAEKVLLVEGPTEYLTLPIYLKRAGLRLPSCGIEIVSCGGKNNIPYYYRLFTAFGIECFCLFDADEDDGKKKNADIENTLKITVKSEESARFVIEYNHAYFAKDFETTIRAQVDGYAELEQVAKEQYRAGQSKPTIARIIASIYDGVPEFAIQLAQCLLEATADTDDVLEESCSHQQNPWDTDIAWDNNIVFDDDIPF